MESTIPKVLFTWKREPSCEEAVREDLSAILRSALESLTPCPEAIYLFGSFALGEGFLLRSEQRWVSGEPYCILIVPRTEPFSEKQIDEFRGGLAKGLHNSDVELHQIPFFNLQGVPAGIFQTDILKSALLLWGNPGALLRFSHHPPEDLPLMDGERLLGEGARELLLACPGRKNKDLELPASFHAGRAIFNLASALLIPLQKYNPSLRVRKRWVKEEFSSFPSLDHLFDKSIHFRTNPGEPFELEDWLSYRRTFLQGVLRFLNWLYAFESPFTNLQDFTSFHSNLFREDKSKTFLRIGLSLLTAYPGETDGERLLVKSAQESMSKGKTGGVGESSWEAAVEQFLDFCRAGNRIKSGSLAQEERNRDQRRDNYG